MNVQEEYGENDYKQRLLEEWRDLKKRYERLKCFCDRWECMESYGTPTIREKPKTPCSLLREQQRCMGRYLSCLERRAIIEEIDLKTE